MDSKLEALKTLHELESKIMRLKRAREAIPAKLRRMDEDIQLKAKSAEAAKAMLTEKRTSSDRFDLDIRTAEEAIKKFEQQLLGATSNKEYNTFLSEIASKKADLSRLVDHALAALSTIDEIVEKSAAALAEFEEARKVRESEAASVEGQLAEIDEEVARLEADRPSLVEQIDAAVLNHYQRSVSKRGETALVPVIDGACQGCFMKVTPETINALKRGTDLIFCKTCSRILYLP